MTLNVRTAAVRVDGLSRRYGATRALDEVDLTLERGITGLLGPNGAGKTTLLSILATVGEPDAGRVSVFGLDPRQAAQRVEIRRRLGYLPQELGYHRHFTVAAFLDYVAILKEITDRRRRAEEVARVLAAVGLERRARTRIRALSGGMRQRLGIAQALLGQPDLLVLDEPTAGLDPEQRLRFRELLSGLPGDPVIVLSTHQADDIAAICPKVVVLLAGAGPLRRHPGRAGRHRRRAGVGGRTSATTAPICPGAAATTGGGTSATTRRPAPSWSRRRSRTATCCCPTRQVRDDRHRGRARAARRGRRRPATRDDGGPGVAARPRSPAADGAGPGAGWRRRCWSAACWCWPGWWPAASLIWLAIRRRSRCGGMPLADRLRAARSSAWPSWPPRSWPPGGPAGTAWPTCTPASRPRPLPGPSATWPAWRECCPPAWLLARRRHRRGAGPRRDRHPGHRRCWQAGCCW